MWQRIQTLYLLISTVLVAMLFFCNKSGDDVRYVTYVPYLVLAIVITLLNILALTTYRFRIFQIRTATLSSLIALALQIWLAVDFFSVKGQVFHITAIFPLVSIITNILAIRGIYADELMVRSADRLRSAKRSKTAKSSKK